MIELQPGNQRLIETIRTEWSASGWTLQQWADFVGDPRRTFFSITQDEQSCGAVIAYEQPAGVVRLDVACDWQRYDWLALVLTLAARFFFVNGRRLVWALIEQQGLAVELVGHGWLMRLHDLRGQGKIDLILFQDYAQWQQQELMRVRGSVMTSLN